VAILGIDCSSNNGLVDWTLAAQRGVQFAFYRKNLCLVQDRLFKENSWGLRNSSIKPCLYTVWDPTYPMEAQVQAFLKGLVPSDWHLIAVDVERRHGWGVNSPRVLNALTYVLHSIANWHGKRPFIYTARSVWNRYYSTGNQFAEFPLWVANYQRANPVLPASWSDYAIWQYIADGNKLGPYYGVKSMSIDLDTAKAL